MPQKTQKKEILVLLDSHAILHRAYHALPATFVSKDGMPTGALYGFSAFLIKVLKELTPNYIIAAYDLPEPTFRHIAYKDYKSHRKETADDLKIQINKSKEILAGFKIPVFEFPGFEADDILGTISRNKEIKELLKKNLKIIIASGDLDTLQLIEENKIVVYTLKKGINDTTVYNEESVKTRFGFSPKLIPDYKGLCGDASDNIIGVKGIGDKSAKELIQKFGPLDLIYKTIQKNETAFVKAGVKKRIIDLLKEQKEEAFFSRELAEIRDDAPINFSFTEIKKDGRPNKESAVKIFDELGFRSLTQRLNEIDYFFTKAAESGATLVSEKNILSDFKKSAVNQNEIFWIFENKKNEPPYITAVFPNGNCFKLKENDFLKESIFFGEILKSKKNFAYKAKELYNYFEKLGIEAEFEFDIFIAAWVYDSRLNNPTINQIISFIQSEAGEGYGALFHVKEIILERFKENGQHSLFYDIEMPLIKVLKNIEVNGVLIDAKKFESLSLICDKELLIIQKKIWELAKEQFNINSTKELRRVLFEKMKISEKGIRKTEGGARSTQFKELIKLKDAHPIIRELISYREFAKLKSTYIDAFPLLIKEDGRIHTNFNQTGTVTGRLSSSNPNLQNIPVKGEFGKKIREAFIVPKGYSLVSFDYSQIELRTAALLSGDEKMREAFRENKDIHTITASEIFNAPLKDITKEMRRKAKVINFGILYGMGAGALSESLGITRHEAEAYKQEYFNDFSGVADYIRNTILKAEETGCTETLYGRKRYFSEINLVRNGVYNGAERRSFISNGINSYNDFMRREIERMAVNMPIQGTSADIIKIAMVRIYEFLSKNKSLKEKIKMVLQIHDELLFEIKDEFLEESCQIIKNIMENVIPQDKREIPFPVEISIGKYWVK